MKGQFSFGIIYGKARPINYLESNIQELYKFNGGVSMNRPPKYIKNQNLMYKNIGVQYGLVISYKENKNIFSIELTGNSLGQNFMLINNDDLWPITYKGIASKNFTRINFQYGYEILKSKNEKFTLIPTLAFGIMPYKNNHGSVNYSIFDNDTSARVIKSYNNHGLNTQITLGLSAKFYLNPRFDLMFNTTYTHGFADKYRYTYMKNFPGHGTLFFDIANKSRFYNANITFLYKLKKDSKAVNKSIGHGAFSFGIISGKTFSQNKIDNNFNTLPNVNGSISKLNKKKLFSRDNVYYQYGITLNYQLKKHYYTLELTTNNSNSYYSLNSNYKETDSVFTRYIGFIKYRRINFQYGYAILETKNKIFSLIPSLGVAILPYENHLSYSSNPDYESTGIYEKSSESKYKRALNTSLVFGLTARVKLNNRFDLQGNVTYNLGFVEQYRVGFEKSYGADGTLVFEIINKARFYNANLVLLYKIKKEKPSEKSSENPFDLEQ